MKRRRWLVAYDISDDRRLRKVHKIVSGHGEPLQYSVFLCDLTEQELFGVKHKLRDIINHLNDSVVMIDLGQVGGRGPRIEHLGQPPDLPSDVGPVII